MSDRALAPERNPFYTYKAFCRRVVDGDTLDLVIDMGMYQFHFCRVRLAGVDTHEVYGVSHDSKEYQRGKEQSEFVTEWMRQAHGGPPVDWAARWLRGDAESWPLLVSTLKDRKGKYGRFLAEVYRMDTGEALEDVLITEFPDVAN